MSNQITGRIAAIGGTVQIQPKNGGSPFLKRELLLDARTYDPYTGEISEYENIIPLEFSQEKCAELDRFKAGDIVTISFALQGRSWQTQDGQTKRMASIRCYKIEARGGDARQAATPQPAAPQYQAAPTPFPPQVDAYGNPQGNDLPF